MLIIFMGGVSASDENNTQQLSQNIDEIVEENTDEILTSEVSSAGNDDVSGYDELDKNILNVCKSINNKTTILKSSNENILSSSEIHLSGGTFDDIQYALDNAKNGDTIFLDGHTYTIGPSGKRITVAYKNLVGGSSLTDTNKATLDAKGLHNHIYMNSEDSFIKNIIFKNGKCNFEGTTASGAICIQSGFRVNITNCDFVNNSCPNQGGALRWNNGRGTISECNFINNTAGTTSTPSWGGAIFAQSNYEINIKNCNFENNTAEYGGAIYTYATTNLQISDSTIFKNNTAEYGGAIYLRSGTNNVISNSKFMNNTASIGGAIYSATTNNLISNSEFMNNIAKTGGAISLSNSASISNSIFIRNKADSSELTKTDNKSALTFYLIGNENYINAISCSKTISFNNVTYWNGNLVNSNDITPVKSSNEQGINITLEVFDSQDVLVDNVTLMTDASGKIVYDYLKFDAGKTYTYKSYHKEDMYYTYIETTGSFKLPEPKKYDIIVLNNQTVYTVNTTSTKINATIIDNETGNTINPTNTKLIFIHLKS